MMRNSSLYLFLLIFGSVLIFSSCKKDESLQPVQPVVTNDTSSTSGRLLAKLYDVNAAFVANADVSIYANYEDVKRGFPLLKVQSRSNGEADFGYILIGNYYMVAYKDLGSGTFITDTTAAQVLSQKTVVRTMILQ